MSVTLNPYLSFKDNAREAMEFYHGILGGKLEVMTFGDMRPDLTGDSKDLIMHAMITAPNGIVLMGADTPPEMDYRPVTGVSISLSGPQADGAELRSYWSGLSAGGMTTMPLAKAQWGDEFGMCIDRYGVTWMVNIAAQ